MKDIPFPQLPIMLVDDEEQILFSYDTTLRFEGFNHIVSCSDSRNVMKQLALHDAELILLDLTMPHLLGNELLRQITQNYPKIPIIIITGNNEIDSAIHCIKDGAFDYLVKPVSKERLAATVWQAIKFRDLHRENQRLREHLLTTELKFPDVFSSIKTVSEKMLSIFRYIEAIANSPQPVLITGETGVGKELLAKAVHDASQCPGEFIAVNIAGLDGNTFSDTLFGHAKGAFTGADQVRKGLLETAAGGTIFLDEIGDLDTLSQVKLLRLLQERAYRPLGSDQAKLTDARIVTATNCDLKRLQEAGKFRTDLYYRLCTHQIHIPPLRERLDDLPPLLDHFLEESANLLGKKKPHPPEELLVLLSAYHFPGNIRELQAMVHNAVSCHKSMMLSLDTFNAYLFKQTPLNEKNVTQSISSDVEKIKFGPQLPTMQETKNLLIEEALKRVDGNKSIAAKLLGVSRQSLNSRKD